jgi:tetratricopeptide (TPR) repeat protein
MKSQAIQFVLAIGTLSIISAGAGCQNQSHRAASINPEPVQLVSSTQGLSLDKSSAVTMEYIWGLAKDNKCRELVQAVDMYLQIPKDENTTAMCRYLQGDSLRQLGEFKHAGTILADVNESLQYRGVSWIEPRGVEIPIPRQCRVALRLVTEQDTCPFPRGSNDYTRLAWTYLNREKLDTAEIMAKQMAHQRAYGNKWPKPGKNPGKNNKTLERYGALFDVGACHFILGQACERRAKTAAQGGNIMEACALYANARECYESVIRRFPDAQCFDPSGAWYWRVKDGAEKCSRRISDRMAELYCD